MPVILERSEESRQRIQDLNILTCVRQIAPIASQARHFPRSGGSERIRKKEFIVLSFYICFCRYSMPDSSLRVRLCFFFHHHSDIFRRSRMTAGVKCVSSKFLLGFCEKTAEWKPYAVLGHGEGGGEAVGRGKYEQKLKT